MSDPGQLTSWKEIAAYLRRTVRTCQRLEASMGLPIHRLDGSPKAHVFAYQSELDAWLSRMTHERERKRKTMLQLYVLAGLTVVGAAALLYVNVSRRGNSAPGPPPSPGATSVAVLPFDDLSPAKDYEYLANTITETVHNALARIRGLQVMGRSSTVAVKAKKFDLREIRQTLNVQNLVEGTVQVIGERLQVTTHLVNTQSGFESDARTYTRKMGDIFEIQDEIARSIVESLGVTLLAGDESALRQRPTRDLEAYNLYMKGRYLAGRPRPEAPAEALGLFEKAIARDPNFALAYVGEAQAYMNMQVLFLRPATEVCPKAEAAAKRALALDPDLAAAHALLGWVQFLYDFDLNASDRSFRRALELNPSDALARGMYAYSLAPRRRLEEARNEIKLALAIDPLTPMLYGFSMWIHLFSGRNEEVLAEFQRVQQIEPNLEPPFFAAGMAYLNLGRLKESMEIFQKACFIPHRTGRPEAGLAVAYLKLGNRAAAEVLYAKLIEEEKNGAASPVHVAWVAASLGDLDTASHWLEVAVQEHDPSVVALPVVVEASAPAFARDPRLLAILDKLGLPH